MTVLPLVIAPDERLNTCSDPVDVIDDTIRTLAANMLDTMYHSQGIGLAAVQVGVLKRIIVADVQWRQEEGKAKEIGTQYILINPEIIATSEDDRSYNEGCLSFPTHYAEVIRPDSVKVRYLDLDGSQKEEEFSGLLSTCIQHEIDHINGINFVDHLSRMKRSIILRKFRNRELRPLEPNL